MSLKVTLLRKTRCRTYGQVGREGFNIWGESPARVTNIVTVVALAVVAAKAIKSVKSGSASKIECMYEAKREVSRVANVVTVVGPAVAIKSVKSGIYEGGQEQVGARGGGGARGRELWGVMWCKVNRPTKVHMPRFSGTV